MQTSTRTRTLVTTALMAAILAVLAPFTIPVGPVPFTLALFAVFLAGAMLPVPGALAAVAVYVLLGVVGLPVFSGFRGGPQVLLGPTGGYIAGYFILAAASSLAMRLARRLPARLGVCAIGLVAFYLVGTVWYVVVTGATFLSGLAVCVAPFALPDLIKAGLALALAGALSRRLAKRGA